MHGYVPSVPWFSLVFLAVAHRAIERVSVASRSVAQRGYAVECVVRERGLQTVWISHLSENASVPFSSGCPGFPRFPFPPVFPRISRISRISIQETVAKTDSESFEFNV